MFEGALDQAAGLRNMTESRPVQVFSITSGKGGVGKTNVSVNLALAMIANGKKVLLMDADLGLANIDVLLGIRPTHNLSHVMNGECSTGRCGCRRPEWFTDYSSIFRYSENG